MVESCPEDEMVSLALSSGEIMSNAPNDSSPEIREEPVKFGEE